MKSKIYDWLYTLGINNDLTERESKAFARNYIDDKVGLNMIKKQYINKELRKKFENICVKSFKLQKSVTFTKDSKLKNYKSSYCCENVYNGNKKKCDLCNRLLKF